MVEDERTFLNNPDINVVKADVEKALIEDVGTGDITGLLIHSETLSHAQIMTREAMILSGIPWANQTFYLIDPTLEIQWHYQEGELLKPNTILCHIEGRARSILTAERTVLNFIQTLSATATQTQRYVKKLAGLSTKLLDTRKTIPGLRSCVRFYYRSYSTSTQVIP
jgi:nicotinate-nucleotide pyrophosphorylase (carboxylating)